MEFHDYFLKGYSVLDSGVARSIVLDLVYDYPNVEKRSSRITFHHVNCYLFKHTTGAIITDIEEVELTVLVLEEAEQLAFFARQHGLQHWETNVTQYLEKLKAEKFRAWQMDSAIGFSGFVIVLDIDGKP